MRKVRSYSREFKDQAAKEAIDSGNKKEVAERLGIPIPTLVHWMNKAQGITYVHKPRPKPQESQLDFMPRRNDTSESDSDLRDENKELRVQLEKALRNVEVLKETLKVFIDN